MTSEKTQKIFKSVNERVQSLIKPNRFYIALYDERRSRIEFPWVIENGGSESMWETRDLDKSLLPDHVLSQGILLQYDRDINTQLKASQLTYWPGDDIPASWLGASIIFEGKTLGVMIAESNTPGAFDQRAASLLATIAGQTATAIERARLDEKLERKIKSLSVINEVTRGLSSDIDDVEKEVLQMVYTQASKLMNTDNMYIALYDRETNMVRFPLMFVDGLATKVLPRKSGSGRTEYIIATKESLFIETRKESVAWYEQEDRKDYTGEPFASWIGVPMINRDRVIGVIAAYHKTDDFVYAEDDLHILSLLATEAAIVIDNAQLLENEKQQNKQLEALQDININIALQLDLKELLGLISEHAKGLLIAGFVTLFLYDAKSQNIIYGVRRGAKEQPQLPTKDSYVYKIAKEKIELWSEGNEANKRFPRVVVDGQTSKSFVGIPLIYENNTVGILLVNYFDEHNFSSNQRKIIRLLGNQAAVAIQNAHIYSELEKININLDEELRSSRQQISQGEQMIVINSFTMDILHRVPNLVGTIPLRADTIIRGLREKDAINNIERVVNQIEGIKRDADNLLDSVKRWNPYDEALKKIPEDVEILLNSALRNTLSPENIEIETNFATDKLFVVCNPKELFESFRCIIENAFQSMLNNQSGKLSIYTSLLTNSGQKWIDIKIADTGHGIAIENLPKIFDLGFTTKNNGMGYGLWRARAVIEKIGGQISIDSAINQGTIFNIKLPLAEGEFRNE